MSDADPFSLLGVVPQFAISDDEIRQRQRAALAATHPDRFSDPVRRDSAMRASAAISAAARVLLDPAARAEALLAMAGHSTATPAPPELLMASLAWRESLDEAHGAGDPAALAEARQPVEVRRAEVIDELAEAIDGSDETRGVGLPRIADWQRARALLTELRLLRRLLESPQERGL